MFTLFFQLKIFFAIQGGSKITADGDCSHEIKRCLLLERKVMTNLESILKSRDITLPTKVHLIKATFFPVIMYGCESWTIKKAKHWRIDAFELWCWRGLLRVPWTAKEMATHSSVLAWRIPWTAEPGGLPSTGLHRVGHDWSDLAGAAADALPFLSYLFNLLYNTF